MNKYLAQCKSGGGSLDRHLLNKCGFTLIEVLTSLIIIGVISVITVPIIFKVIETSKKKAFKETVESLVKSASLFYADEGSDHAKEFDDGGDMINFKFDEALGKEGVSDTGLQLSFNGKSPIQGFVYLYSNGDIAVENVTNGKYFATKDVDEAIEITTNSTVLTRDELSKAVKGLQSKVTILETGSKELQSKVTILETGSKELQNQVKDLKADNAAQNNTIKGQNTKISNLETSNNVLNKSVTTNKGNITSLQNKDKDLETKIADVKNSIKDVDVLNKTYPVGSIYISASGTSPVVLFGGSWEVYGTGRTLVGINTGDYNFNTAGKIGGSNTNTLTVANLPSHTHSIPSLSGSTNSAGVHNHGFRYGTNTNAAGIMATVMANGTEYASLYVIDSAGAHSHTLTTNASTTGTIGSTTAINNLQPYITVYMWKRTA